MMTIVITAHPGYNRGIHQHTGGGMRKILIVDDEPGIVTMMKRFLEKCGYEVFTAENGERALGILREGPEVGLLILDSRMPKMGGIEVLRTLRTFDSGLPAVILSGDIHIGECCSEFFALGCAEEDILSKPVSLPELKKIVNRKLPL